MSNSSANSQEATRLIECPSDSEWDTFILTSPQSCVFSLSGYLASLGVTHDKLFYAMDGQILASALIVNPSDSEFFSPYPYSLYQGIALAPIVGESHSAIPRRLKVISGLADALSQRYPRHSLCLHHTLSDLRGFQWCNYHEPERGKYEFTMSYTGVISLGGYSKFEDYLASIRLNRLKDLKKFNKSSLTIGKSDDVKEFLKVYRQTFARQDIEVDNLSITQVESLVVSVLNNKLGELHVAKTTSGQAISAIVTLFDKNCTYYLFGATDPEYRDTGVGTALMIHCISNAYSEGRLIFDMVGINSPQRGDFKISFNAEPKMYASVTFGRT